MTWVRYGDQFCFDPRVEAVVSDDAGALALHVLANTWTNGQRRQGFVPPHQPGYLVCDKARGSRWADVLVSHGLWHSCNQINQCADCSVEYQDLPESLEGYVFHQFAKQKKITRPAIPDAVRDFVFTRDQFQCVFCAGTHDLTLDHIYPWSLGGSDLPENLQVLCRSCNSRKGANV
jgi:hypothetical protein